MGCKMYRLFWGRPLGIRGQQNQDVRLRYAAISTSCVDGAGSEGATGCNIPVLS